MSAKHLLKVGMRTLASMLEPHKGMGGTPTPKQPRLPIKIYEFEGCPYCRRVRQALTMLNLDVEIYPCPRNGTRYRPWVHQQGGKAQFPYLVDDNTQVSMYESQAIIDYLFKNYGEKGRTPSKFAQPPKIAVLGTLSTLLSGMGGVYAAKSNTSRKPPAELLHLWSFEGSPFSRPVRELLCELEIPYQLINVAKEQTSDIGPAVMRLHRGPYVPLAGGKREKLFKEVGKVQVPYLKDPNTAVSMFESKDILHYLMRQYG